MEVGTVARQEPSELATVIDLSIFEPFEREQLSHQAYVVNLAEGSHLFAEADEVNAIFLVIQGTVYCYRSSLAGREVRERVAGPGELVCPLAIVDGRPAPASVRARCDSQCVAIPADVARQSVERATPFGRAIVKELCRCCRRMSRQLTLLSLEGTEQRVAWVLSELCENPGNATEVAATVTPAGPVELRLTHGDLAALVGTSREVVSRALSHLRGLGLVQTGRRRIAVPDVLRLVRFTRGSAEPEPGNVTPGCGTRRR